MFSSQLQNLKSATFTWFRYLQMNSSLLFLYRAYIDELLIFHYSSKTWWQLLNSRWSGSVQMKRKWFLIVFSWNVKFLTLNRCLYRFFPLVTSSFFFFIRLSFGSLWINWLPFRFFCRTLNKTCTRNTDLLTGCAPKVAWCLFNACVPPAITFDF